MLSGISILRNRPSPRTQQQQQRLGISIAVTTVCGEEEVRRVRSWPSQTGCPTETVIITAAATVSGAAVVIRSITICIHITITMISFMIIRQCLPRQRQSEEGCVRCPGVKVTTR